MLLATLRRRNCARRFRPVRVLTVATAALAGSAVLVIGPVTGGVAEEAKPVTPAVQNIDLGTPESPAADVDVLPADKSPAPPVPSQSSGPSPTPQEQDTPSASSQASGASASSTTTATASAQATKSAPITPSPAPTTTAVPSEPKSAPAPAPANELAPSAAMPMPSGSRTLSLEKPQTVGFSSIGISWIGDAPVNGIALQVRVKSATTGDWSDWSDLSINREALANPNHPQIRQGSDPYWFGSSGGIEVAVTITPGTQLSDLKLTLIDPKKVTADSNAQTAAPTSSAGAASQMPPVYSRKDWGADESKMVWTPQYTPSIQAATLHHTADGNNYSSSDVPGIMRSIYQYQAVTLGWGDIGYNVVVDKFGRAWEGRAGGLDKPVIGAHAGGFNRSTFGVSMLGNYDLVAVPDVVKEKVAQLIAWKFSLYDVNPTGWTTLTQYGGAGTTAKYADGQSISLPTIFGHRDVGNTVCPGQYGYATLPWIRSRVQQLYDSMQAAPVGNYESATAVGTKVTLGGWAYDTDSPSESISVAVYRNGTGISWFPTSTLRSDVNGAYGISGNHGFTIDLSNEPPGENQYCVFAIDPQGDANPLLGCRTIGVGAYRSPFGNYEAATKFGGKGVNLSGWTVDPDSTSTPGYVAVYRNGQILSWYPVGQARSDVNAAYGVSSNHGFSISLSEQSPGANNYCVFAIDNEGTSPNPLLGCKSVQITARQALGYLDVATVPTNGTVRLAGWVFDPDIPDTSTYVAVYRDGKIISWYATPVSRPDVNAAYGLSGAHGFDLTLTSQPAGWHQYCMYAIADSLQEQNPLFTCTWQKAA